MRRSWISMEEQLAAVENLIRRCHNVGNLSDCSQDVHINTQMLNGWRMSEWKVAVDAAKIHSSGKPTQVHTPGSATGSWHALKWTWHSSLRADVNPGQIITSEPADIFPLNFCLLKVPPLPRGSLLEPGRGGKPGALQRGCWVWLWSQWCFHGRGREIWKRRFPKRSPNYWQFPPCLSQIFIALAWFLPRLLPHVTRPATSP